jgi:hypothetical protein
MFLQVDHINGGGGKHKRSMNNQSIYRWLVEHNFPAGFQILCSNCNIGRYKNGGVCPHQVKVDERKRIRTKFSDSDRPPEYDWSPKYRGVPKDVKPALDPSAVSSTRSRRRPERPSRGRRPARSRTVAGNGPPDKDSGGALAASDRL